MLTLTVPWEMFMFLFKFPQDCSTCLGEDREHKHTRSNQYSMTADVLILLLLAHQL